MGRRRTREVAAGARSFAALRGWPREAIAALHDWCERRHVGAAPTAEAFLHELAERFGVAWNDSSLSRYYGFWEARIRVEQEARDQAVALARAFLQSPTEDTEAILSQLLQHQRLVALSNLGAADPVQVAQLGLDADKLELKERELALKQQVADLARRRVELSERAAEVAAKVEERAKAAGKTLDPEVARMIREEVYGLPAQA